jgi:hypothetical protein
MNGTRRIMMEATLRRGEFTEVFYPWIENSVGHPRISDGGVPPSGEVGGGQNVNPLLRDQKSTNTLELFAYGSGREDWRCAANSYTHVAERATKILKPSQSSSPDLPVVVGPDPWTIFVESNKPAFLRIPQEAPQAPMKSSEISECVWTTRWRLILILNSLLLVAEASVLYVCLGR